jgi:hypothetical protein
MWLLARSSTLFEEAVFLIWNRFFQSKKRKRGILLLTRCLSIALFSLTFGHYCASRYAPRGPAGWLLAFFFTATGSTGRSRCSFVIPARRLACSGNIWHRSGNILHYSGNIWHRSGNILHYSGLISRRSGNIVHYSGNMSHRSGNIVHYPGNILHYSGLISHRSGNTTAATERSIFTVFELGSITFM